MFDTNQMPYKNLRSIINERTNQIIAWIGSGLSAAAGLPTWEKLKENLCNTLENKASTLDKGNKETLLNKAKVIRSEKDYWLAFQQLKESLGGTTYRTEIRSSLSSADTVEIPDTYKLLIGSSISGILNLNLDRIATRSFTQKHPGKQIIEFNGNQTGPYCHILKNAIPFIVNLHGNSSDESSWVFTRNELKDLIEKPDYQAFISSCLTSRTIIFLGITADDVAVGGHLERLSNNKVDFGTHYWITHKTDSKTDEWAEKNGIQIIRYCADDNHKELIDILTDLNSFHPIDSPAPPVKMVSNNYSKNIRNMNELRLETSTEKLRYELNSYANELLKDPSQNTYQRYLEFCNEYDEAIYRSWYISSKPPENILFNYEIEKEIAEGAYGRVFKAKRNNGSSVAIKLLKEDLRRKKDMLQSFRRGVRSMRILAERGVKGMVPYEEASEIPAFCVMDFVEGPNLNEAVLSTTVNEWHQIIEISVQLAKIIRKAHQLPERVLHRDIRPPNIMLNNYYTENKIDVVVLDFDLSWHMDADELSITPNSTIGGYLAPEQVLKIKNVSTRNAAVDSFGLGMTLYFMRTSKDPLYLQHRHADWEENLFKTVIKYQCKEWNSVPNRYARLIYNSTKDIQSQRWDMTQILGELELLKEALLSPQDIQSGVLLVEELTKKISDINGTNYFWDNDRNYSKLENASGVSIEIKSNEVKKVVRLRIEWSNKGDRDFKNVRKYLYNSVDKMISMCNSEGWSNLNETFTRIDLIGLALEIPCSSLCRKLDSSARIIADGLKLFTF